MRPNLLGILGICYVVFLTAMTIGYVGQPNCETPGVYSTDLPVQMFTFFGTAFTLGYFGRGKL